MISSSGVLYVGVTNNLQRRIYEHKHGVVEGFTKKYGIHRLLYIETFSDITAAIRREKQIKNWNRAKKAAIIDMQNPNWDDLSEDWYE